jgi:hypothetical protein
LVDEHDEAVCVLGEGELEGCVGFGGLYGELLLEGEYLFHNIVVSYILLPM